jgi:hypothetical protein
MVGGSLVFGKCIAAARAAELMIEHEISEASIAAEAPGEQRTRPSITTVR